jgi:alkylated DNA repair dioxygenase AlkB
MSDMQPNLFQQEKINSVPKIEGFSYHPNYISPDEEKRLIETIDQKSWMNDLKRRVQHYGYRYDYKSRIVKNDFFIGTLPAWLNNLSLQLHQDNLFPKPPDQVIVNEYLPGQGISAHIDCIPCFGKTIASLSLGSGAVMVFTKGSEKHEIYLEPRSLVLLSGAARYEWSHSIPARQSDNCDGIKIARARRLSLTFRNVIVT